MEHYIAGGKYGKAILENLDCLAKAANDVKLPEAFTDYYLGFKNLIFLHEKIGFITKDETRIILKYLDDLQRLGWLESLRKKVPKR